MEMIVEVAEVVNFFPSVFGTVDKSLKCWLNRSLSWESCMIDPNS